MSGESYSISDDGSAQVSVYASGDVSSSVSADRGYISYFGLSPQYHCEAWGTYTYCSYPGYGDPGGPVTLDFYVSINANGSASSASAVSGSSCGASSTGEATSTAGGPNYNGSYYAVASSGCYGGGTPSAGATYDVVDGTGTGSYSFQATPGDPCLGGSAWAQAEASFSVNFFGDNYQDAAGAPPEITINASVHGDAESHVSTLPYECDGHAIKPSANASSHAGGSGTATVELDAGW